MKKEGEKKGEKQGKQKKRRKKDKLEIEWGEEKKKGMDLQSKGFLGILSSLS